jgi:VIT1/CCC1 family predicted Fe2+/Mn2+ transporter
MDKKTAMQELINLLETQRRLFIEAERHTLADGIGRTILLSKQFLEKEKEQIIEAYEDGKQNGIESITNVNKYTIGEYYYNQTYGNGK